jgi:hypothetical protein
MNEVDCQRRGGYRQKRMMKLRHRMRNERRDVEDEGREGMKDGI